MLNELRAEVANRADFARDLVRSKEDGRIKLYVTHRALQCCRDWPGLFSSGEYLPLESIGQRSSHLFGFARHSGERTAIVVVPRLLTSLMNETQNPIGGEVWQDTRVLLPAVDPAIRWRNVFTGEILTAAEQEGRLSLSAAAVLASFPVALLIGEPQ